VLGPSDSDAIRLEIDRALTPRSILPVKIRPVRADSTTAPANDLLSSDGESTVFQSGASLGLAPTGGMVAWPTATAPSGWALCDGSSVLRAGTYANLFAVIGTTYGSADSTHFNLPDLRGRVPVGLDNLGGSDAGRLAAANTLGGTGGTETHTLVIGEIPAHDHSEASGFVALTAAAGSGNGAVRGTNTVTNNSTGAFGGMVSNGGGGAHNNMQPYILMGWIIKL
jgi:microcystin-dependent protein